MTGHFLENIEVGDIVTRVVHNGSILYHQGYVTEVLKDTIICSIFTDINHWCSYTFNRDNGVDIRGEVYGKLIFRQLLL